jgi:hypothetical protein
LCSIIIMMVMGSFLLMASFLFCFACATSPEVGFEFGLISGLLFLCLGWCACGSQMGGVNGSRRRYAASGHAARLGALKRSRAVGYDPTKHAKLKMLCSQKKSGWCRIAVVGATFLGAVATGVRGLLGRFRGLSLVGEAAGAIVVFLFRLNNIVGSFFLQVNRLGEKQQARSSFSSQVCMKRFILIFCRCLACRVGFAWASWWCGSEAKRV